jgi:hypothetical protein
LPHPLSGSFSEVKLLLLGPAHVTNLLQKKIKAGSSSSSSGSRCVTSGDIIATVHGHLALATAHKLQCSIWKDLVEICEILKNCLGTDPL